MDESMTGLVGSLISTGAGLWNNSAERDFNAEEAEKNRQFQKSEREAAQQWELDMWNKTNEYNSLSSQIDRAREAGVSPSMIINDGAGTSGLANPLTSTPSAGSAASYSSSLGSSLTGLAKQISEIDLLNKEADKVETDIDNVKEDTRGKKQQNDFWDKTEEERVKEVEERVRGQELDNAVKAAQHAGLQIDNAVARQSFYWMAKMPEAQYKLIMQNLNNLKSEYRLKQQQITNAEKQGSLIDEQIATENAKQSDLSASAKLKTAQTEGQEISNEEENLRLAFAKETKLPLGSSEYEFQYWLYQTDQLEDWNDKVVYGETIARSKPIDWVVTKEETTKSKGNFGAKLDFLGIPIGDVDNVDESETTYRKTDIMSPKVFRSSITNP